MSRKKISTTIYVTPEQAEKLKLLNERTKVAVAEYIRQGIDLILKKNAHMLPGQLPLDAAQPVRTSGTPGAPSNGARAWDGDAEPESAAAATTK